MKGIDLTISTIIIIILCIAVLLTVSVIYFNVWNPSGQSLSLEAAKNNACQMLVSLRCGVNPNTIHVNGFDADGNGVLDASDHLQALCKNRYGITGSNEISDCKSLCMCGSTGGTSGPSGPGSGLNCDGVQNGVCSNLCCGPSADPDCPPKGPMC